MSYRADDDLQTELLGNFLHLNAYVGNKYTQESIDTIVGLILASVFKSSGGLWQLTQLPVTGESAPQVELRVGPAVTYFIKEYAHKLWPRRSNEAGEDFEPVLRWIIGGFVRNVLKVNVSFADLDFAPIQLVRELMISEDKEALEKWKEEGRPVRQKCLFRWVPPLRESKSDDNLVIHGKKHDRDSRWKVIRRAETISRRADEERALKEAGQSGDWLRQSVDQGEQWLKDMVEELKADKRRSSQGPVQ